VRYWRFGVDFDCFAPRRLLRSFRHRGSMSQEKDKCESRKECTQLRIKMVVLLIRIKKSVIWGGRLARLAG
jgi:hypothetical protein